MSAQPAENADHPSPTPRQSDDIDHPHASHRLIFAEMIRHELDRRPLTRHARHEFLNFALRLGIPRPEANLLIRAAEFDAGHVAHEQPADDPRPLPFRHPRRLALILAILTLQYAAFTLVLNWLR